MKRSGIPYLDESFPLDDIKSNEVYKVAVERAATAWPVFAAWCAKCGAGVLPPPRLWFARTKVA